MSYKTKFDRKRIKCQNIERNSIDSEINRTIYELSAFLSKEEILNILNTELLRKTIYKGQSIEYIEKKVCNHFSITSNQIHRKTRDRDTVVVPRQFAHLLAYRFTKHSLSVIGNMIGGKNHATVLHSIKVIKNLLDVDIYFAKSNASLIKSFGIEVSDIINYKRPLSNAN